MLGLVVLGGSLLVFGALAVIQIVSQKQIALDGIRDKHVDVPRFGTTTMAYAAGGLACVYVIRQWLDGGL